MKKGLVYGLVTALAAGACFLGSCQENKPNDDPGDDTQNPGGDDTQNPGGDDPVEIEGLVLEVDKGQSLNVAQWTDLHYGDPSRDYHNGKEELTKAYLDYFYRNNKPDFIVCGGDNILSTGVDGLNEFIELMDSFETPWTFVFGNHDSEDTSAKEELSNILAEHSKNSDYLYYDSGYVDAENNRYGNFSIKIKEKDSDTIRGALVFLDTGVYDYTANAYESITQGQIDWYSSEIDELQEIYGGEGVVPTVIYQHMQTPEFHTAYTKALAGTDGVEFVVEQDLTQAQIDEIKNGGPTAETGFFAKVVEKASTKAIFVGHAHNYGFQVKYNNVVLGFGPQTGHSNNFAGDDEPRWSYSYEFDANLDFTTTAVKEQLLQVTKTSGTILVGETFEADLRTFNFDGDLTYEVSDDTILEVNATEFGANKLFVTGLKAGKATITITGENLYPVVVEVTVENPLQFKAYKSDGSEIGLFDSFFAALDEMYVLGAKDGQIKVVTDGVVGDVVYGGDSGKSYAWMDGEGLSTAFDNGTSIVNGQFSWFSQYESALKIHTQNVASMMFQSSGNTKNIGKFFARPTDFDVTNTDGAGGYNGNPDDTWNGWRASVYKAGVTVAQYNGWADNGDGYKYITATYDLTNSLLYPSENPNQPVRADIWLGSSSNPAPVEGVTTVGPVLLGISVDAGTVESTKDLADGTKRDIKLFYEKMATNGGLAEAYMGERVYGDTVGYAVWDKAAGCWKFEAKYTLTMDFGNVDNLGYFKVTVGDKTLTLDLGYQLNTAALRFTYGVNLTPDTETNNRVVVDLRNGARWTNVVQESILKMEPTNPEANTVNMGFLEGRVINGAREIAIFGSDVCEVVKNAQGNAVFTFKY